VGTYGKGGENLFLFGREDDLLPEGLKRLLSRSTTYAVDLVHRWCADIKFEGVDISRMFKANLNITHNYNKSKGGRIEFGEVGWDWG
jgi:hypothetical protein